MNRSPTFAYVKYNQTSLDRQAMCLKACEDLEHAICASLAHGREYAMALAKLEECYMWIGKAIRNHQVSCGVPTDD